MRDNPAFTHVAGVATLCPVTIHPDLLELVRCPRCRGVLVAGADALECAACRVAYPVLDGIPRLLVDEARPLDPLEKAG